MELQRVEYDWTTFTIHYGSSMASLVAQMVKNLPAMQGTRVQSLGQEGPLGKGMATHSSIFARRTPWTEEPGGLQFMGSQTVRHDWATLRERENEYMNY